jgi:hypothetical protein
LGAILGTILIFWEDIGSWDRCDIESDWDRFWKRYCIVLVMILIFWEDIFGSDFGSNLEAFGTDFGSDFFGNEESMHY